MKFYFSLVCGLFSMSVVGQQTVGPVEFLNPKMSSLIDPEAKIEVLASGFSWAEGPVWVPKLNGVVFTDVRDFLRRILADLRVGGSDRRETDAKRVDESERPAGTRRQTESRVSWSEKLKSRRRKKTPTSASGAKRKGSGKSRRESSNTRMRAALLGRFFGQKRGADGG